MTLWLDMQRNSAGDAHCFRRPVPGTEDSGGDGRYGGGSGMACG